MSQEVIATEAAGKSLGDVVIMAGPSRDVANIHGMKHPVDVAGAGTSLHVYLHVCSLLAIDDTVKKHPVSIVINIYLAQTSLHNDMASGDRHPAYGKSVVEVPSRQQ